MVTGGLYLPSRGDLCILHTYCIPGTKQYFISASAMSKLQTSLLESGHDDNNNNNKNDDYNNALSAVISLVMFRYSAHSTTLLSENDSQAVSDSGGILQKEDDRNMLAANRIDSLGLQPVLPSIPLKISFSR